MIKRLLADRRVRRTELAFSGFNMAEYGVWVSVLVYAYERGGTIVTAAVAVAQLLPAGLVAPVLARSVDRGGAAAALYRGYWLQASSIGATAVLLLTASPAPFVYASAILAAIAVTVTRPAQAALVALLAPRSDELTAINVLSGWVESLSVLAGPALAGVLIAFDGPGASIGFFAVCTAGSALLVRPLVAESNRPAVAASADTSPREERAAAIDALREDGGLSALILLLGAQYFVIGALDVLMVALAIGVLGLGPVRTRLPRRGIRRGGSGGIAARAAADRTPAPRGAAGPRGARMGRAARDPRRLADLSERVRAARRCGGDP